MPSVDLPFGRTEVTAGDLHRTVDVETVRNQLQTAGIANPDDAVSSLLDEIPELLAWLESHGRDYPWRRTTDPWRIYATEILLQRTRSDAVADLYDDFFEAFPEPGSILDAEEQQLREIVHPLGFVNHRVRSLTEAAEMCVYEHDGAVPADLDALQRPWRVGPYTARATLIFAFDRPLAIVDTNTARITGRVFGYPLPEQPHKSDRVYRLLDALVPADPALARALNLALLDLGALLCTSESPNCASCPLEDSCDYADRQGT